MIVEDRGKVADSIAGRLACYGHEVRIAVAARTPWPKPEVVLMDIGLPDMDGWAVARELREHARGQQPIVVAVTGRATAEGPRASEDAGIDLYLVKPAGPWPGAGCWCGSAMA